MIVYRPPFDVVEALGRGEQQRVPMKGPIHPATPCPDCDNDRLVMWDTDTETAEAFYCETCNGSGERLVAPIQPATRCPDCDCGNWPNCPTCEGAMWLGGDLGLVTEQWRLAEADAREQWHGSWHPIVDDTFERPAVMTIFEKYGYDVERRLVVPWRTQVTELLPVYDTLDPKREQSYVYIGRASVSIVNRATDTGDDMTDEPWAQHLTPGMFVATLVGLWPIDPPVVDVKVDHDHHTHFGWKRGAAVANRRPLSVDPGEVVTLP